MWRGVASSAVILRWLAIGMTSDCGCLGVSCVRQFGLNLLQLRFPHLEFFWSGRLLENIARKGPYEGLYGIALRNESLTQNGLDLIIIHRNLASSVKHMGRRTD